MGKSMADREEMYQQVKRAQARHNAEFDKYLRMLTSGITRGRRYSEEALAKQLAKADEALAAAQLAYDEGTSDDDKEKQGDN